MEQALRPAFSSRETAPADGPSALPHHIRLHPEDPAPTLATQLLLLSFSASFLRLLRAFTLPWLIDPAPANDNACVAMLSYDRW